DPDRNRHDTNSYERVERRWVNGIDEEGQQDEANARSHCHDAPDLVLDRLERGILAVLRTHHQPLDERWIELLAALDGSPQGLEADTTLLVLSDDSGHRRDGQKGPERNPDNG